MRLRARRLPFVAVALAAAVAFPLGVLASHQFSDVPNGNLYHTDIDALVDSGVTTGCGGGRYCPSDYVTREQMAAFMNRLGALQAGRTPVVNADRLDGRDSTGFLGAGDIVIPQRGPWVPAGEDEIDITYATGATNLGVATPGGPVAMLLLQVPGTIAGVEYGIESVEVCHGASTIDSIYATRVFQLLDADSDVTTVIADMTERDLSSDGCYTVTDPTPVAVTHAVYLIITLNVFDPGTALIGTVTTTWTPIP